MPLQCLQPPVEFLLTSEVALPVVHPGGREAEVRALRTRRSERDPGLQLGVLVEDRLLERGELGTRIQAELGGEQLPPAADGGQRIRLAPLAVLRQAEDHPATLAHRRFGDPGARLRGRVEQVTRLEARLQQGLLRRETDLFQPIRRDLRRLPVGQLGEGLPAPQRESLRERMRRAIGLAEFEQLRPSGDEPLEPLGVEIDAVRREPVSRSVWSRSSPARSGGAVA